MACSEKKRKWIGRSAALFCLALALGAIISGGYLDAPGRIWMQATFVSPSLGYRVLPPFPAANVNPFAVKNSGIGKTLSGYLARAANGSDHLGVSEFADEPYHTAGGRFIGRLGKELEPKIHVHARSGHGVEFFHRPTSEGEEESGEDDRSKSQLIMLRKVQSDWAMRKAQWEIQTAFLLDPANYTALQLMLDYNLAPSPNERLVNWKDWDGNDIKIPISSVRRIKVCDYALGHYDMNSGLWPIQCLYGAQAYISIWLALNGQVEYSKETLEDRRRRVHRSAILSDQINILINRAWSQKANLERYGIWELEGPEYIRRFDTLFGETNAMKSMLEQQIQKNSDVTGLDQ